jgi:hypothetical protein
MPFILLFCTRRIIYNAERLFDLLEEKRVASYGLLDFFNMVRSFFKVSVCGFLGGIVMVLTEDPFTIVTSIGSDF